MAILQAPARSDQETEGFGRFPGRQMPLRVGFLLRALVDQFAEGSPVLLGEVLKQGDHRLQHLHHYLGLVLKRTWVWLFCRDWFDQVVRVYPSW